MLRDVDFNIFEIPSLHVDLDTPVQLCTKNLSRAVTWTERTIIM